MKNEEGRVKKIRKFTLTYTPSTKQRQLDKQQYNGRYYTFDATITLPTMEEREWCFLRGYFWETYLAHLGLLTAMLPV
jgi:hypothetical protein